jgi:hypothetical protein
LFSFTLLRMKTHNVRMQSIERRRLPMSPVFPARNTVAIPFSSVNTRSTVLLQSVIKGSSKRIASIAMFTCVEADGVRSNVFTNHGCCSGATGSGWRICRMSGGCSRV